MKKAFLFEDMVNYYNKWTSGIASKELATQRVTLKDLFDKTIDQHPNQTRVEKPLPYPLPSVIEQIGELYLRATNSKALFTSSLNNPVIQKNLVAKKQVQIILGRLEHIINEVQAIMKDTEIPVAKNV